MKQFAAHRIFILAFVFAVSVIQLLPAQQAVDPVDSTSAISDSLSALAKTNPIVKSIRESRPKIVWSITFGRIFWSIAFFLLALLTIRYCSILLEKIAERWPGVRLLIKRIIPAFRIVVWTIALYIIIAMILAPPIETLIALTASAGIAIGFASQDILKNIFGGIMILLDRPFQVGDKIDAGGNYGEVVQIGLRSVRIVTADDNLISIPNGEIMNQAVSNANAGEFNCQVVAEFHLPVDVDIDKVKEIAYYSAAVSRYIYLNKPIAVVMKNEFLYGHSLLKLRLKAYVLDLRYEFAFASEMTEIFTRQLVKEGIIKPHQSMFVIPD